MENNLKWTETECANFIEHDLMYYDICVARIQICDMFKYADTCVIMRCSKEHNLLHIVWDQPLAYHKKLDIKKTKHFVETHIKNTELLLEIFPILKINFK